MSAGTVLHRYTGPEDLVEIESIPLADRGLPDSTYAVLERAATLWPDRPAVTVLTDGFRWQQPARHTFGQLRADAARDEAALRTVLDRCAITCEIKERS